ncbi:MAG: UDP-N-acetylglucosamine--LPS N-acetylglucosamine transferase [Opitutae bacterium]|nr:UDP-N-acetylglucosamine--LPS N-acetylglucosamine transferase [Opitutae bacterium]
MKILVLTSSTGGGHDSRARALRLWAESDEAKSAGLEAEVKIERPLEQGSSLYGFGTWLYNAIQKSCPRLHKLYFPFLEKAGLHRNSTAILGSKRYQQTVSEFAPDIVFSVHAHLNHAYCDLARKAMPARPPTFVIYCGELSDGVGFSRHWINPEADLFTGPLEETCEAARSRGMPEDKTFRAGFLLRPPFYHKLPADQQADFIRRKWDLDPALPLLVLGTGANGVNRHLKAVAPYCSLAKPGQVVALCGSNERTRRALEALPESLGFELRALSTIDAEDMAPLLRSANLLFARPGAGTTSEAIVCGTPMLFDVSGGIMPQEQNNLNLWEKRMGHCPITSDPSVVAGVAEVGTRSVPYASDETPLRLLEKLRSMIQSG